MPASILSAAIGMACLGGWALLSLGPIPFGGPGDIIAGLFFATLALGIGTIAATFVVAFYLCLFGLPIAVLLGKRIGHPFALAISLLDAAIGALVATTGNRFGLFGGEGFTIEAFALVLCFALPAGYIYRRNVIALREITAF